MNLSRNHSSASCSRCGKPLIEARLEGVCPACLWTDVFAEPVDEGAGAAGAAVPTAAGGLIPIPGHEVLEELARGGMGIVYRARQLKPSRIVALKMLLPHQIGSESMRERFRLEIQAASGLDHPAILPVFQVGEQGGLPWFSMKLAGGGSLAARRGEFTGRWKDIAPLLVTLADAVQFAHERGVLHRDLKPGNVLFDEAGRPYVSDFGLAKVIGSESDLTRSVDFLGTPHYAAPEVAIGSARSATTASDIYSLGVILYELLAGRPPFEAEGVPALLRKIADEEPGPFTTYDLRFTTSGRQGDARENRNSKLANPVPRDLSVICLKCLAKEPARRYSTARELAEDLRRWLDGRPILARPATRWERVQSWARRNPALAALSAVLIVVLAGAMFLEMRSHRRTQRALGQSLLAQAGLQRGAGRIGQRFETLALVRQAMRRGADGTESGRAQLRTEVAGALALPDARMVSRWSVPVAHFENEFDFSADLSRFAAPTTEGGCVVSLTTNRQSLWTLAAKTNNPAVRLRISPRGDFLTVRFQNKQTEVHRVEVSGSASKAKPNFDPGGTPGAASALTPALSPLRGEGDQSAAAGQTSAIGRVRAPSLATAELKATNAENRVHITNDAQRAPSLLDGERAGVRGEDSRMIPAAATSQPVWSSRDPGATTVFAADGRTMVATERKGRGGRLAVVIALSTGAIEAGMPAPEHNVMTCDASAARVAFAADTLSVRRVSDASELWVANLPAPACAIAWSPDGRRLAVGLRSRQDAENPDSKMFPILIFDAETGRQESVFAELSSNARRVAFHPDGESLAVATWHAGLVWGSVRPDGFRVRMEGSHRALTFAAEGSRLAFSPTADELGMLELVPPSLLRAWPIPKTAERSRQSTSLSADGRWLALTSADGLALWDATARRQLAFLPQPAKGAWTTTAFAERDSILYYASISAGVRRFDLPELLAAAERGEASFELSRRRGPPNEQLITGLAPDGRGLLVLDFRRQATNEHLPPTAWLWPEGDPDRARKLVEDHPVNGAALIPGTQWLVTTDLVAPDVTIWNAATGAKARTLGLDQRVISKVTSDGRWLLTRTRSEYGVWEVGSWRLINRWPTPPEEAQSDLTPMPGAPVVVVSTTDGRLRLRHLPDGGEWLTLPAATRAQVVGWIFSPDARKLVVVPNSGPPLEWDLAVLRAELATLGLDWD